MTAHPAPPPLNISLTELPRAGREVMSAAFGLSRLVGRHSGGDGHPVLVLPGYGAADGSTRLLRRFIGRIGYRPYALDLGRNLETPGERIRSVDDATRFRAGMSDAVVERVREIYAETGRQLSLVGWSMGGLYALDASREVPEFTRQVITLGAPFGDPRGTSLFRIMRRLSGSQVPLGAQNYDGWVRRARPAVPTRVIYSPKDGIVGTGIARMTESDLVEYRQVNSSHTAFAVNPLALSSVAECLRENHRSGEVEADQKRPT